MGTSWYDWLAGRLSAPVLTPGQCGACGWRVRPASRFCAHCGRPVFAPGASEEVLLPAWKTVRLAGGLLLGRYEPASSRVRPHQSDPAIRHDYQIGRALVVLAVGDREQVYAPRELDTCGYVTRLGARYELVPLEIDENTLRLLVRRAGNA